jgi:hypothetical protein
LANSVGVTLRDKFSPTLLKTAIFQPKCLKLRRDIAVSRQDIVIPRRDTAISRHDTAIPCRDMAVSRQAAEIPHWDIAIPHRNGVVFRCNFALPEAWQFKIRLS